MSQGLGENVTNFTSWSKSMLSTNKQLNKLIFILVKYDGMGPMGPNQ